MSEDVVRKLRRMNPKYVETIETIKTTEDKMKFSGYSKNERVNIIESGITSYFRRKQEAEENGEFMWQTEEEAQEKRDRKKLEEKEIWYCPRVQ